MNKYQDKEASMDDYSHEKKLKADGRYEAAKGKMGAAKNDFDHAHALKKDAGYDAKNRKGGNFLSKHWNHSSPLNMINGASGAAGMNPLKFVDIESGEVDGVPFGAADVNGSIAVDVGYPDTSNRG